MKKDTLKNLGSIAFNYAVIALLGAISLVLILPFFPFFVGSIGYFAHQKEDRSLGLVFKTIKENWNQVLIYSISCLILFAASLFAIYFSSKEGTAATYVLLVAGYLLLTLTLVFFLNAPIIMLRMKVNFKELIFDSFTLLFGHWYYSLILLLAAGLSIYVGTLSIFALLLVPFFLSLVDEKLNAQNFLALKAKALKVSEEELKTGEKNQGFDC